MSKQYLCLDIGGTNTRIGVVSDGLGVTASAIESTPALARDGIGAGLQGLVAAWAALMRATFPLSDRREDTFVAGLSMGGFGALRNGWKYADTFGCIAALSSAITVLDPSVPPIAGDKAVFGDLATAAETDKNHQVAYAQLRARVATGQAQMPALYLACGTDDPFIASTRALRDQLAADGVDLTYDEMPGGHDWDFWDAQIKKVIDWLPLDEASQGFGSGAIG